MSGNYEHILHHPHHVSATRPQMRREDRAAQFGSFKALSGFEDGIEESGRYVEQRQPLTEVQRTALDAAMQQLLEGAMRRVAVTYFVPDARKSGGVYTTYCGMFRFLELDTGKLKFTDGTTIDMQDVWEVRFLKEDL